MWGRDSTNTGTPTSQTLSGKERRIPNARVKTGNSKGGQTGHEKHSLEKLDESEVTNVVPHCPDEDVCCPKCYIEYTAHAHKDIENIDDDNVLGTFFIRHKGDV